MNVNNRVKWFLFESQLHPYLLYDTQMFICCLPQHAHLQKQRKVSLLGRVVTGINQAQPCKAMNTLTYNASHIALSISGGETSRDCGSGWGKKTGTPGAAEWRMRQGYSVTDIKQDIHFNFYTRSEEDSPCRNYKHLIFHKAIQLG